MRAYVLGAILPFLAPALCASAATLQVPSQYSTIQSAMNAASSGDTVLVASGVYVENVQVKGGVALVGAGWKTTVIDGGQNGNVVSVLGQTDVASFVIQGFTIRNSAKMGSSFSGSGIFVNGKSCCSVVCNGFISDNRVLDCEYGIYIANVHAGTLTVTNNIIVDNKYNGFDPYLGNSIISNNTIVGNGGNGYSDWAGGGSNFLENNIIAFNTGVGIRPHATTPITIQYNDVYSNGGGNYVDSNGPFVPSPGTGEISADPLFVDMPGGDYFLTPGSPCVDTGNPGAFDPDGSRSDMGAMYLDPNHITYKTEIYGTSCAMLSMGVEGIPVIGSNIFVVSLSGAPPTTAANLLIGISKTSYGGVPLPLDMGLLGAPGCTLVTSPAVFLPFVTDPAGNITLQAPIPFDSKLMGFPIYLQWLVHDLTANPLGMTFSEGLEMVVGN